MRLLSQIGKIIYSMCLSSDFADAREELNSSHLQSKIGWSFEGKNYATICFGNR